MKRNSKMAFFECLVRMGSRVNSAKRFTHTRLSGLCSRKWTLGQTSLLQVQKDWLCEAIYMSCKYTLMHKTTSGVSISGATQKHGSCLSVRKLSEWMEKWKQEQLHSAYFHSFPFDLPPKTEKLHPQREREALRSWQIIVGGREEERERERIIRLHNSLSCSDYLWSVLGVSMSKRPKYAWSTQTRILSPLQDFIAVFSAPASLTTTPH